MLLSGKVTQLQLEFVIIECLPFFVKQIQQGLRTSALKVNRDVDFADFWT